MPGTYAPPAVALPKTIEIVGIPSLDLLDISIKNLP